ncbi:MAG TPA: DUF434 domain-containing protein [Pyrinomonadaceae bacterium]
MSPDKRQHRGAHPADERLFASDRLPELRTATAELSWLLSRGYAMKSALKLVGDRYDLKERQRTAVSRAACTDDQLARRAKRRLPVEGIAGQRLLIDGFNLIITTEAALGGGPLLLCRDSCIRDLSSVHGSYRSVQETEKAIHLIGETLATLLPASVEWFLDRPVSNSGRLAERIRDYARVRGYIWSVEVIFNPDQTISCGDGITVTSDSLILDEAARSINFNDYLIRRHLQQAWLIDLT